MLRPKLDRTNVALDRAIPIAIFPASADLVARRALEKGFPACIDQRAIGEQRIVGIVDVTVVLQLIEPNIDVYLIARAKVFKVVVRARSQHVVAVGMPRAIAIRWRTTCTIYRHLMQCSVLKERLDERRNRLIAY
jgi:hypothetical protein